MALVFPFGEGPTDGIVFHLLKQKFFSGQPFREFVSVNGKNNFRSRIVDTIKSEILPNTEISVLVFRDLDAGESSKNVVQTFRDITWSLLSDWGLRPDVQPHQQHPNIYVCAQPPSTTTPGLRLVLHLADNSALNLPIALLNHTTDSYVLAAGFTNVVLERFAEKVNSNAQSLHALITSSIPRTITETNSTFDQDKDYLAAYLCATRFWVKHRTEKQELLVRIILNRIWKYDQNAFLRIFASWQIAIEEALR